MMNEVQLFNLAQNDFWITFVVIIFFVCGLSWFLILVSSKVEEKEKNTKEYRKAFKILLILAVSLTVLASVLFKITSDHFKYPDYNDSKYYIVKNLPLTKYSLEDNQFETKNGKIIKNISVTTDNSIKVTHEKVQLKEYKLKNKWYGMNGVPRTIYQAYVLKPANNTKTVKN